jgi:hypothetical protein
MTRISLIIFKLEVAQFSFEIQQVERIFLNCNGLYVAHISFEMQQVLHISPLRGLSHEIETGFRWSGCVRISVFGKSAAGVYFL